MEKIPDPDDFDSWPRERRAARIEDLFAGTSLVATKKRLRDPDYAMTNSELARGEGMLRMCGYPVTGAEMSSFIRLCHRAQQLCAATGTPPFRPSPSTAGNPT